MARGSKKITNGSSALSRNVKDDLEFQKSIIDWTTFY